MKNNKSKLLGIISKLFSQFIQFSDSFRYRQLRYEPLISMSGDGSVVILVGTFITENDGNEVAVFIMKEEDHWTNIENIVIDIFKPTNTTGVVSSVDSLSLSHNGRMIAIGSVDGNSLTVVKLDDLYQTVEEEKTITSRGFDSGFDAYGSSVAINSSGTIVAVGAPLYDCTEFQDTLIDGKQQGIVYFYDIDNNMTIIQRHLMNPIQIENGDNYFGLVIEFSGDDEIRIEGIQKLDHYVKLNLSKQEHDQLDILLNKS